jgi:N-acetylglucosaminyl-diphospho-decaprenol L-rhamnosyltransferase
LNKISIGIVLYQNSEQEVWSCLDSIASQEGMFVVLEVLIRDQGGTLEECVSRWKREHLIPFEIIFSKGKNLGFGAGHNILFDSISSESIAYLCLNPDAQMHPLCIQYLYQFAQNHDWNGIFEPQHEPVMLPKYYDPVSGITEWCSGACVLIPASIYRELKGFDEQFFMYCEDVDFSWRARALGFNCYVNINAQLFHFVGDRSDRMEIVAISQYILACKWGALDDQLRAKEKLIQSKGIWHADKNFISDEIVSIENHLALKVMPNFSNGDTYARVLWT